MEMKSLVVVVFVHLAAAKEFRVRRVLVVCLCLALLAGAATAQEITGTITGSVQDPAGAQIPGAPILATNVDTGIAYKASTTDAGIYVLLLLPAGHYRVSIEMAGFKRFVRENITLAPDQRLRVDMPLELGSMSEQISVTAETPVLRTEQSSTGGNFQPSRIEALPVGRSPDTLMQLLPGVQAHATQGLWVGNNNGSPGATTDLKVDGVPATNNNNGLVTATPVLELVEQVVVQTSNYSAEFGRGATQVEMTTRPGGNRILGTLFEYFGNDALDANSFMSNFYGGAKPIQRSNVFGGTISGPVYLPKLYDGHNRTFFTFGYQGTRDRGYGQVVSSVPTETMRAGNFAGGTAIYDPVTTRGNPAGAGFVRDVFPANVVPAARMDPVSLKVMEVALPLPNLPGTANNYVNNGATLSPSDAWNTRVDHNFSQANRMTARYLYRRVFSTNLVAYPGPGGSGSLGGQLQKNVFNHSISADDTSTLRPNLVNNAHFGYFRNYSPATSPGTGEDWASKVGLKGVGPDKFPQMRMTALTGVGGGAYSIQTPGNTYQLSDSLLAVHGRHTIKAGFEYRKLLYDTWDAGASSGNFNFNTLPTANIQTQRLGLGFASYLLGIPSNSTVLLQYKGGSKFRWNSYSAFVQDDYRASSRLTLNLGLRWETETPRREVNKRQSQFNLSTLRLEYAGQNGYPETLHNNNWKNFAPRAGFAYTLTGDGRTVVRGAYGLFYLTTNTTEGRTAFTTGPWSRSYSFTSLDNGVTFPVALRNGLPPMSLDDPFTVSLLTGVMWIARDYPTAYMQQWSFNVQRDVGADTVLEAGYVGTKGTHLRLTYDLNQIEPSLLGPGNTQSRRPYPTVGGITASGAPVGNSNYHALQFRFERRMIGSFSYQGAYTFSKSIDNASQANVQNNYDLRAERSLSLFDLRHNLAFGLMYRLPVGKGRSLLSSGGVLGAVLGGWNFGVLSSVRSGIPLSMLTVTNLTGSMSGGSRPNRLRDGKLSGDARGRMRWFDQAAFALPEPYTFGNTSSTEPGLQAPGQFNCDLLLAKEFRLTDTKRLALRSEFSNALNHFNPGSPDTTIGGPGVGVITTGNSGRTIQLALRLHF